MVKGMRTRALAFTFRIAAAMSVLMTGASDFTFRGVAVREASAAICPGVSALSQMAKSSISPW